MLLPLALLVALLRPTAAAGLELASFVDATRGADVLPGTVFAGTPEHLEAILMGRCYAAAVPGVPCDDLWRRFSRSWTHRASDLDVTYASYAPFFTAPWFSATLAPPRDAAVFWSGTQDLMEEYQGATGRYTMEFSPVLRLFQGLSWCTSEGGDGMNHTACVAGVQQGDEWAGATAAFWGLASQLYAVQARGAVHMLFRSHGPGHDAYRRGSFFGSVELPRIPYGLVTSVTAIVVPHSLDGPPLERCGRGSMALLLKDLVAAGLDQRKFRCLDNPQEVRMLLCAREPASPRCRLADEPGKWEPAREPW